MSGSPEHEIGHVLDSSGGNPAQPHPLAWREMHRWLEKRSVGELQELAERHEIPKYARRKADLVRELVAKLAHPEHVVRTLEDLSQGERAALELIYLLAADGHVKTQDLRKALLAWHGPLVAQKATACVDGLAGRALLFGGPEPDTWRLPQAVLACLESLSKPLDALDSARLTQLQVVEYGPATLPEAVLAVWQYCQEYAMTQVSDAALLSQTSREGAARTGAHVVDLLEELSESAWNQADHLYEDIALVPQALEPDAVRAIAQRAGLSQEIINCAFELALELGLATKTGKQLDLNELAMERFHRHGQTRQLQSLLSAWLASKSVGMLHRALLQDPELRVQRYLRAKDVSLELFYRDLEEMRRFAARLIGLLERDRWYTLQGFLEAVGQLWAVLPFLPSQKGPLPKWRLAQSGVAEASSKGAWAKTYGALFAALISGPLTWLGGLRLAFQEGQLVAFQVNSLGRYLCGHYPQLAAHEGDMRPLAVADDLTVSIQLGRVDAQVHDFLGRFADLVEAESDVFRYRITPKQLNEAFEDGLTLAQIREFLERVGGAALPDAARRRLEQWHDHYGTVRLYSNLTIIEFADDYALQELLNTTSLASAIIHQLSPRMIVIEADAVEGLMAEMTRKGYTPKLEEATP